MDPGPTHKVETKVGAKRRHRDRHRAMASKASTPPYPSAAKISDSLCYSQYSASLKCLEEYGSDKSKCQEHFDIYKECKKKEREARLERNRNRSFF
ncbi:cytochrome c oxidase-assembly factor COX23, mitochondrial [Quercus robur]|uniref:cytochrome c oxidase-assembly factor COX23, mitochondrial n=1 Tax=Quercus robur TaxID=38942 RepID=UPI002161A510|nr:cytochrome c oxidase-assembly factor COX23, mitochondrial [Quercus robur]